MGRRKASTEVRKENKIRAEHVKGMGDVKEADRQPKSG
jgi:hypothetical protein